MAGLLSSRLRASSASAWASASFCATVRGEGRSGLYAFFVLEVRERVFLGVCTPQKYDGERGRVDFRFWMI